MSDDYGLCEKVPLTESERALLSRMIRREAPIPRGSMAPSVVKTALRMERRKIIDQYDGCFRLTGAAELQAHLHGIRKTR